MNTVSDIPLQSTQHARESLRRSPCGPRMERHGVEVTVGHSVPSALADADLSCTIEMSAAASRLRGRVGRLSRTLTRLVVVLCAMQADGVLAQGAASAYPTRPI